MHKGGQEGRQGGQEGHSAILFWPSWNTVDDGMSSAGDSKSGSAFMRGSIISKRPHVFECIYIVIIVISCYMSIKTQYSYNKVIQNKLCL